jgi:TolB protein
VPDAQTEAPAQPTSSEQDTSEMPKPPQSTSQSGTWYYFDGKQWLKYSSGEPADISPPDPRMILEQEPSPANVKVEPKSEPVVAELFEEDEPPVEVVDVEVITVIEAEPDPGTESNDRSTPEPPKESIVAAPMVSDEVRPRRSKSSANIPVARSTPVESQPQPKKRTPADPGRPVTPRKRAAAHEPTIIIPTGSATSNISSPSSARKSGASRPTQADRRRARENTLPLEPMPVTDAQATSPTGRSRHRQVTQAMPPIARTAGARPDTGQMRVAQRARQPTKEKIALAATKQPTETEPEKTGYTLGDILRAFPSTLWTIAAGLVVLLLFAIVIIGAWWTWSQFQGDSFGVSSVAPLQGPTPTLAAGPPDSTPTPGPTPSSVPEPIATSTRSSMVTFSSADLDFTLEYPEGWQNKEETLQAIFSPSVEGLDPDELRDTSIRIGIPADNSSDISDLLTGVLAKFPADVETLNEGTISIASQTWTSTQIRFENENLGGRGIATLAVTNKDGMGYFLVAAAPAEQWNSVQPLFQAMINSFRFGAEIIVAQATSDETLEADKATTPADKEDGETEATPTPTRQATPTSEVTVTPLVYVVQSGDTLLGIAIRFGVDDELLAAENGIQDPESLQLGQELIIPFTAEELAAYNANGGSIATTTTSQADDEISTTEVVSETGTTETVAPVTEAPTEEPVPESEAAPVSGRIVYPAYNPGIHSYDLWLVDLATGEQTPIVGQASQPTFSRDGSLMAYRSWDLGTRGVFFRDFVGGRGGIVTRFVEDGLPTWAPDGYSFAFASRKEGDRVPRIYIGNQLGEEPFSIGFQGEYPSTFPDGRLVIKGCLPTGDCGIFVMGSRGGGETKISDEPSDTAPAVSPDGGKIAFMSSGREARNWEIWVMNGDGSNPQRLTENGNNDGLPTWSPDGQSIAYVSDQGGVWAVWVMNADGSNQRKLFDMKGSPDGVVLHDESNSKGWLEERISWAP